jgi:hypothetical protein
MYACVGNMHPDYVDMSARLFFILEAHGLQGTVGHVVVPESTSARRRDPEPEDT